MFSEKRIFTRTTAILGFILSSQMAMAAYQVEDDDGWSAFDAQLEQAANQSVVDYKQQHTYTPPPEVAIQPVKNYKKRRPQIRSQNQAPVQAVENNGTVYRAKPQISNQPIQTSKRQWFRFPWHRQAPDQPVNNSGPVYGPQSQGTDKDAVVIRKQPERFYYSFLSSFVVTLSGGPVWDTSNDTQTLQLTPYIKKSYQGHNQANVLAYGELFMGFQRDLNPKTQGQLGLALGLANKTSVSGDIWDDADPNFDNYTYAYDVRHAHILLKGKVVTDSGYYDLKPYLSAGVGVGLNKAGNYSSTPLIFEAVPTPDFASNSTVALALTLGLGVQRPISDKLQAGIGYEFGSWGKSHLGRAFGQTTNEELSLNHLYTNAILVNLTYLG
jgi:opacity protein-like surface antigen